MYLYSQFSGDRDQYLIVDLDLNILNEIKTLAANIPSNIWYIVPRDHGLQVRIADNSAVNESGLDTDALIAELGDENESMFFNDLLIESEEVNTSIEIANDHFNLTIGNWDGSTSGSASIFFDILKI
jgi:hypothetical protein